MQTKVILGLCAAGALLVNLLLVVTPSRVELFAHAGSRDYVGLESPERQPFAHGGPTDFVGREPAKSRYRFGANA